MRVLRSMQSFLDLAPSRLEKIPSGKIELKPVPVKRSPTEELVHLLDPAANHHQRIVRTRLADTPTMPGYMGDRWVQLPACPHRDWRELVDLRKVLRRMTDDLRPTTA
jgi:hypothetical protein